MVNLTVRNIPDEILKRIRIFAARERRSLNSELLIVIEDGIAKRISGETGTANNGYVPGSGSGMVSPGAREKLWKELCGSWTGERILSDMVSDVYGSRGREIPS